MEIKKKIANNVVIVTVVVLAFGVLLVSVGRAGLERTREDEKANRLRKIPVDYSWETPDEIGVGRYYLPETSMLPNHWLYSLKAIRDYWWLKFTRDPRNKATAALFLADKKIAEAEALLRNKEIELAKKCAKEAIMRLNLTADMIKGLNDDPETDKLQNRIREACFFYADISKKTGLAESEIEQLKEMGEDAEKER